MHALHLHHPELQPAPDSPALPLEESARALRAVRFAADVAFDNREDALCEALNLAADSINRAVAAVRRRNVAVAAE